MDRDWAESVDDLICTFDGVGDRTMDTLAMFVFGWILAALFLLWLGKLLYSKFVLKEKSTDTTKTKIESATTEKLSEKVIPAADVIDAKVAKKLGAGVSKGKSAAPTPPVRKRLTRQSPGPDLRKAKFIPAPQCTGPDNVSVLWVNDVFQWLYNDLVIVNELLNVWIQFLNDYSKKSVTEQGVGVEFIRILPETHPPALTNLFCECDTRDDVTITCDCEATPAFQLKCFRQKGDKVETSHYRVNVNRFRARLNIFCVSDKLQAELKCDGWPEIKVALAPVGNIKNNLDETQLQEVISDIVVNALRSTEVQLNLGLYPTCPRLVRHVATPGHSLPVHYDSMLNAFTSTPNHAGMPLIRSDKRLLVKVIRATHLGVQSGCTEPYCVVEMDEPPQKNQTSVQKSTDSPYWDEHFLFDLSPNTAELLFEVYDRASKPPRFLGLGIVGVEELLINPSQRQIITLQSRPYESDSVSGTLTVEFLFIEGADIPNLSNQQPFKVKETIRSPSPSGPIRHTTTTTYHNATAISDLEHHKPQYNTNKSTLVIHSVQRHPSQRLVKQAEYSSHPSGNYLSPSATLSPITPLHDQHLDFRGRPRKRRDFFGTIKRRLNKSKGRSKSAGPGENDIGRDDSLNRSISADRRIDGREETSRRSSLSEASGLSSASTRTYVNEASTLVLETIENGVKKHYLVPLSLAQKSKWRKKGTKLHIFNDHTFIAKHLSGGTICQVCSKSVARRIGKQGYECRDCLLKCHKHCHVKVNDNCPTSTILSIELSLLPVLSE
uniref:Phorbol-ester/DAG-type domain-containing protein n=1 Tax=Photinus pyralis TaxID=7054 RepID=A0A1Y1KUN5_PHOPY